MRSRAEARAGREPRSRYAESVAGRRREVLVLLWTTVLDSRGLLLQGGRPRQRGQRSLDCRLILYDFCCVEASGRTRVRRLVIFLPHAGKIINSTLCRCVWCVEPGAQQSSRHSLMHVRRRFLFPACTCETEGSKHVVRRASLGSPAAPVSPAFHQPPVPC